MTDKKLTYEQLVEENRKLQKLLNRSKKNQAIERALNAHRLYGQLIIREKNEKELFEKICKITVEEIGYKLAWIGIAMKDKSVLPVASAGFDDDYLNSIKITWNNDKYSEGPTGQSIKTGKYAVMQDILNNPNFEPWEKNAEKNNFKSSISIPLFYESKVFGTINIYSEEHNAFNEDEILILQNAANDLSIGVSNIRQLKIIQKQKSEIEKAKEDAIEISSKKKTIVKNFPNGSITLLDRDFKIQITGGTEYSKFKINPDNHVNKHLKEVLSEESYRANEQHLLNALKGESSNYIVKSNNLFYRNFVHPIMGNNNKIDYILLMSLNITNFKIIEDKLIKAKENAEKNESKLLAAIDSMTDAVFISDVNGNISNVNDAFIEYSKFKNKSEFTKSFSEYPDIFDVFFLNGELALPEMRAVARALRGEVATNELYIVHKKGTNNKWIGSYNFAPINNKSKEIVGCVVTIRDVTDKINKEEELIRTKDKAEKTSKLLSNITDNMLDMVSISNHKADFIFVSKSHNLLGYNTEELTGKNVFDFIHPDDKTNILDIFSNFLIKKDKTKVECRFRTKDGSYRWVETIGKILNEDEIIFNSRVIDDRIEYEEKLRLAKEKAEEGEKFLQIKNDEYESLNEELRQTNEELYKAKKKAEESDRLKSAFLQNLSHEIRTPLNAISGFSGMLNKPGITEEKRSSFVSIINTSSNQLLSIVSDILTVSSLETKQEKLNIQKVFINNIIVDLVSIFKPQSVNQNISLYTKQYLSDIQSEIYTDKTKLTQILSNLISNALKFTHEGSVEFGYTLRNDAESSEIEFYVKDSGIGINPSLTDKIFERFRQADLSTNKRYGGTGLGLSISKGFVELLGGKIWLKSEEGKGSTFYFTIPYKPVSKKNIAKKSNQDNKPTILIAEDEGFNYLYIEQLLINSGCKIIHAKDGKETVEIVKTNKEVDLILMDIKMPKMDGYTAAKIIKGIYPELPIIGQSAYGLQHEIEKYSKIFNDYLAKPIKEKEFIELIKKHLTKKNK